MATTQLTDTSRRLLRSLSPVNSRKDCCVRSCIGILPVLDAISPQPRHCRDRYGQDLNADEAPNISTRTKIN